MESNAIDQLLETCRHLAELGYAPASGGNASIRTGEGVWITAGGCTLRKLARNDLVRVDEEGRRISGQGEPSKEVLLHLAAYRAKPEISTVLHLHPPQTIAVCSCLSDGANPLPAMVPTFIMRVQGVYLLPFYPPGDPRLVPKLSKVIGANQVVLLRNHGLISTGTTVLQASQAVEETEENARIYLLARGRKPISPIECARLRVKYWLVRKP